MAETPIEKAMVKVLFVGLKNWDPLKKTAEYGENHVYDGQTEGDKGHNQGKKDGALGATSHGKGGGDEA